MTRSSTTASLAKDGSPIKLSGRVPPDLSPSKLARSVDALQPRYDLTETNPTRVDFAYPDSAVATALGAASGLCIYEPAPMGLQATREFLNSVTGIPTQHLMITASTSEAYAIAIKTFVDPGGLVAAPRPCYPLIPYLAQLEGVGVAWYDLVPEDRFRIDWGSLERALDAGARIVVIVSPNNPTGTVASAQEITDAAALCARRGAVLIIDRVFSEYPLEAVVPPVPLNLPGAVIVLDGLSKRAAMPQIKLAWMELRGERASELVAPLSWTSDAYLSVSTPSQRALPALWNWGEALQAQVAARLRANLAALRAGILSVPAVGLLPVGAGWSAVLRVPRILDDDGWVLACARAGVRVHPGYFYEFDRPGYLVISLLPKPQNFAAGVRRLVTCAQELM